MTTTLKTIDADELDGSSEEVKGGASIVGGGLLIAYGLLRRDLVGLLCTVGGAGMIVSCAAKRTAGTWAAATSIERFSIPLIGDRSDKKIKCKRAVTIAKSIDDVYAFLSDAENFPKFMTNVEKIVVSGDSYEWTVKNLAGGDMSWKTTIEKNDVSKELTIQSLADSEAGGTVRMTLLPVHKARDMKDATEVHVELEYFRPNVKMVATIFHLLGKDPAAQIEGDLGALKQLLEAGEIARNHA